jgi:type I restriction enzyme M protein
MMTSDFSQKTKDLIDGLKGTCANYGLGNDGNEFKIITQVFLYKFINDKFGFELKLLDKRFVSDKPWEGIASALTDAEFSRLVLKLPAGTAKLKKDQFIANLFNNQNTNNFAKLFDSTLIDISSSNADIFSVNTDSDSKIVLFEELSLYIADQSKRDDFCKALVNQLVNFSFENIFNEKFDFFATIFEYLIKDYNKDGGGKYAEYYTPHAVSSIMAKILVNKEFTNVTVYDPSAGSGTLLMNVAHEIGESNCSIFSQDISQKSSGMLRLNLILNNLVHSIPNIIQGNTLQSPYFRENKSLKKFDFIVSNPPFKLDFSEIRSDLDTSENSERFFAGIPTVPKKKKESMAIYLLFVQHIIFSMNATGKAAIVVPTGFLTADNKIVQNIRKKIIDAKILRGVITMPSNIFATTGTNVSVLFLDKSKKNESIVIVDASNLGTTVKEGKNQKTLLSRQEEETIVSTFNNQIEVEEFSFLIPVSLLIKKNYSLSPMQYSGSWDARTLAETHSVADLDDQIRELTTMLNKQLADGSTSSSVLKSQLKGIVDEL